MPVEVREDVDERVQHLARAGPPCRRRRQRVERIELGQAPEARPDAAGAALDQPDRIAPAKLESLFTPFSQQSADRSGLGLGLSIARRGAAANGGEVRARSVPGDGCVFTLELPGVG